MRNHLITKRYGLDESNDFSESASASNLVTGYVFKPKTNVRQTTADELVIGALESSFIEMVNTFQFIIELVNI